jgi:hypothetical protein
MVSAEHPILVVDDNEETRFVVSQVLAFRGYVAAKATRAPTRSHGSGVLAVIDRSACSRSCSYCEDVSPAGDPPTDGRSIPRPGARRAAIVSRVERGLRRTAVRSRPNAACIALSNGFVKVREA